MLQQHLRLKNTSYDQPRGFWRHFDPSRVPSHSEVGSRRHRGEGGGRGAPVKSLPGFDNTHAPRLLVNTGSHVTEESRAEPSRGERIVRERTKSSTVPLGRGSKRQPRDRAGRNEAECPPPVIAECFFGGAVTARTSHVSTAKLEGRRRWLRFFSCSDANVGLTKLEDSCSLLLAWFLRVFISPRLSEL